ncbi:hypothetical protein [Terrihabitans rhizophilus]|uniref:Uncharacterized protein n=1 Tax=Terrihabitans rhizophilus TaxID=3092662 RepID=A0ABU4RLP5_9HYPH|nr:hypothetical protein [Terrihabitans sp. PJ23]MDX6804670.1 hypothetical protein [Terrihabitans sp. PJ23]
MALVIEDRARPGGLRELGLLDDYLNALRRAQRNCHLSTYAYGATLSCRSREGREVLIGLTAEPSRQPEFVRVLEIRPDGVNSISLPNSEFAPFLSELARTPEGSRMVWPSP